MNLTCPWMSSLSILLINSGGASNRKPPVLSEISDFIKERSYFAQFLVPQSAQATQWN
jgi:hypothetical protein